jgi:alanyl-tRNA synthetase
MKNFVPLKADYGKTEKVFHQYPYSSEAEATVVGQVDHYVVLDRTVFYPISGGQDPDVGAIEGAPVSYVHDQAGQPFSKSEPRPVPRVNVDTTVVHHLADDVTFEPGQRVRLSIDWDRRYKLMRNHSAAHFVFHGVTTLYEEEFAEPLVTKGCRIATDGVRFDFSRNVPKEIVDEAERIANDWMQGSHPISMVQDDQSDEIFYWTCEDIVIPCGGTHVQSTDELGPVSLRRSKKGSNLTRVAFSGVSGE